MCVRNSIMVLLTSISYVLIDIDIWFFNTMCICNWGKRPKWELGGKLPILANIVGFVWVFMRILWGMAPIIIMLLLLYPPNQTKYAILEKYLIWPLFVSIKYIFWREIRSVCTSVHVLCLKKGQNDTIAYLI